MFDDNNFNSHFKKRFPKSLIFNKPKKRMDWILFFLILELIFTIASFVSGIGDFMEEEENEQEEAIQEDTPEK